MLKKAALEKYKNIKFYILFYIFFKIPNKIIEYFLFRKKVEKTDDKGNLFFLDIESKLSLINEIKKAEIEEIIKNADEIISGNFTFTGKWEMERTHIPVKIDIDKLYLCKPLDKEWIYTVNRHGFILDLAKAYYLTKDEKYSKEVYSHIKVWIENQPFNLKNRNLSWRKLDLSIRVVNWIKALELIKGSEIITDEFLCEINLSLFKQGQYLNLGFNKFSEKSNWGIIESYGLFILSEHFFTLRFSESWGQKSRNNLAMCFTKQFYEDGVHWEQSLMYHHQVLFCYLNYLRLDKNIEQDFKKKVENACYASLFLIKPNKKQLLKGDSDDTSLDDFLTEASLTLKNRDFKYGGMTDLSIEQILSFSLEERNWYLNINGDYSKFPKFIKLEESGNYAMRSSWEHDANMLYFYNGPYGGGHSHGDNFHISLSCYGVDFLIDSGRYNYEENYYYLKWREYLKNSSAHNVFLINNEEFFESKGSWQVEKKPKNYWTKTYSNDNYERLVAFHDGYGEKKCFREIIFFKKEFWILIDYFPNDLENKMTEYFHFNENNKIEIRDNIVLAKDGYSEKGLEIVNLNGGEIEEKINWYSPHYNILKQNKLISIHKIEKDKNKDLMLINILNPLENYNNIKNKFKIESIINKTLKISIARENKEAEIISIDLNSK